MRQSFRVCVLLFLAFMATFIYAVYQQILYVRRERKEFLQNYHSEEDDFEKLEKGGILFRNKRMYLRNVYKIRTHIKWFNKHQEIHNIKLGPINSDTYVIVIQCHSNVNHLRQLLKSLRKVSFIHMAFLIFSHDHYSHKINKLIKTVNFAKYMQIFYPYSMQLHPNVFPGAEPKSCVEGFPCIKSKFRDPEASQSKHHWWWQANQIFDHLKALQNFHEPILFLEENNYVIEDTLVVFKLLVYAKNIHCPFCEMISLAAHDANVTRYKRRQSIVTVEVWTNTIPNTAIAFDRRIWTAIKSWKEVFCFYNDSKWDNSLKHLGAEKWDGTIYLTAIDGPRVFRFEKCDDKEVGCKLQNKIDDIRKFIKLVSKHMYPLSIKIKVTADEDFNVSQSGYWSDVRDQELCMQFANHSVWY